MQKMAYVIVVNNDRFISVDSTPENFRTSEVFDAARFFPTSYFAEKVMIQYVDNFRVRQLAPAFHIQPVALLA